VQAAGGHPLERAWRTFVQRVLPGDERDDDRLADDLRERFLTSDVSDPLALAAARRSRFMWPWETPPRSVASGILDDEAYDWRAVVAGMLESGGWPLVVDDALILRARDLARARTGADVSATGAVGLAGLLALAEAGLLERDERVGLVLTGVQW
jgi:threonine synthase